MTVTDSGSQTATVSTEHTLGGSGITTNGTYVCRVDLGNLALGDDLALRVYTKTRTADTLRLEYETRIKHVPQFKNITSPAIPIGSGEVQFRLEQLAGTGRAFPWTILQIDG